MLEIKVTYFPTVDSEAGPLCISERLSTEKLAATSNLLPGETANKLTRILFENSEAFKDDYKNYTHSSKLSSTVELSQRDVSNQLNEKNDASDAVLFPFYVTYGIVSNLGNRYSIVLAESREEAQKQVKSICGNKYCAIYNKKAFGDQAERYNLTLVALQPQQMRSR